MSLVWEHWVLLPPKEPNRHNSNPVQWWSPGSSAALCHQLTVQVCSRHKQLAEHRPDAHLTVGHGQSKPTSLSFGSGERCDAYLESQSEAWQWDSDSKQSKVMTQVHHSINGNHTTNQLPRSFLWPTTDSQYLEKRSYKTYCLKLYQVGNTHFTSFSWVIQFVN